MNRRLLSLLALLLAATLLLAACGGGKDLEEGALNGPTDEIQDEGDAATDPDDDGDADEADEADGEGRQPDDSGQQARPAKKTGDIIIEGTPQAMELILFTAPEDWPAAFTTYYTGDLLAETVSGGGGHAVNFIANFGGIRNDDALVQIFFYEEGTTQEDAELQLSYLAADFELKEDEANQSVVAPWSRRLYTVDGGSRLTWLALGEYGDTHFYVLADYPGDYGDGFGARLHDLLAQWQWSDTGAALMP